MTTEEALVSETDPEPRLLSDLSGFEKWEDWLACWDQNTKLPVALGLLHGIFDGALGRNPQAVRHLVAVLNDTYADCGWEHGASDRLHRKAAGILAKEFLRNAEWWQEMFAADEGLVPLVLGVIDTGSLFRNDGKYHAIVTPFLLGCAHCLRNELHQHDEIKRPKEIQAALSKERVLLFKLFLARGMDEQISHVWGLWWDKETPKDLAALKAIVFATDWQGRRYKRFEEALGSFPKDHHPGGTSGYHDDDRPWYSHRAATLYVSMKAVYTARSRKERARLR